MVNELEDKIDCELLFDFGLTEKQEKLAKDIHDKSILIDMLFAGPLSPQDIPEEIGDLILKRCGPYVGSDEFDYLNLMNRVLLNTTLENKVPEFKDCWYASGITCGNRQLDLSDRDAILESMVFATAQFDKFDWLVKATKAEDIRRAKRENKKAGLVTTQETLGIGKDLGMLDILYAFGLRVIQLTYNKHNLIGAGCFEKNDAGISSFGEEFIRKMNKLGIIVDTGHCGRQTTLDACLLSNKPVIASHTGVKKVFNHTRSKTDEEIIAVAKTNGVVGVYAMPSFITQDSKKASINHILDHIDYIVDLVGDKYVGIGTDYPESRTEFMSEFMNYRIAPKLGFSIDDGPAGKKVDGFSSYKQFINITRGLITRGYSEESIMRILGGNWLRVIEEVCG